jgi:pyruvate dehydrogenase E2 component (dihydrolipoamide acetyltransferase)
LAVEGGVSLATLRGSGPDGAVLAADVLSAQMAAAASGETTQAAPLTATAPVQPAVAADGAGEILPMSRPWRIMAQRLQQSWTTAPHFYLAREVNCTGLVRWREGVQGRSTSKITVTDLLVKLVAAALRLHPRLNAAWLKDEIVLNRAINIGLAVAVEDGLLVPVVSQADHLGLNEIAAQRAQLVERAQNGKLTPADLSGGTFTISNLGMFGIDDFNAIVNPPQAAILAVGRIADKIVPLDGQPAIQPMMTLTLSCDHRVVDGARAAQYMQTLVGYIEDPLRMLD